MSDLTERLEANRAAVGELIRASKCVAATWTTPTAPGKWSPAQIVEHVALSLEEGAKVVEGEPSKLPRVPLPLRPVARMVLFKRVLRRNRFAKAKTNPEMDPLDGPASPEEARRRLEAACDAFEAACRTYATRDGRLRTPFFGTVDLDDYVRFTELHTRHHCRQMPTM